MERVKAKFKILEEEDFVDEPQGVGYRSIHLIAQDDAGQAFEVQVRTKNQDTWANWAHDIYKPLTDEQRKAVKESAEEIGDYALRMSAFFFSQDEPKEKEIDKPSCPQTVAIIFGCM